MMERDLYDLDNLADAIRRVSQPTPRWLIVLCAPLAIGCVIAAGIWKWSLVRDVRREAAAIKDTWRQRRPRW